MTDIERAGPTTTLETIAAPPLIAAKIVPGDIKFNRPDELPETVIFDGRNKEEIKTDTDKIRIALKCYREAIKWRTDWVSVAGIIITISLSIVSTTFKEVWIFSSTQVMTFFIFGLILSIIIFIYIVSYSIWHWKEGSINYVIQNLKDGCRNINW